MSDSELLRMVMKGMQIFPPRHESALIEQNSIKLDEERVKLLESRSVIEDREGRR